MNELKIDKRIDLAPLVQKKKVAAYCRVFVEKDAMLHSLSAQISYYQDYINKNSECLYVRTYADEGISGTNIKKLEGFNEKINDVLNRKIDLIVTKSVSRFARNTVDSLVNIKKLKERNVECYFEKENIYTFDSKGELLITIMSNLVQEESRFSFDNVT